jgi:hypothetical protein
MCDKTCDCKNGNCDCRCSCGRDGCGGEHRFERSYQTKAEQNTELEAYLSELKLEVQAVEEHLADLKK